MILKFDSRARVWWTEWAGSDRGVEESGRDAMHSAMGDGAAVDELLGILS